MVAFENAEFSGEIVPQHVEHADKGIVRFVVPSAFIYKEADGTTMTLELNDLERRMPCRAA